jgi:hypothetical protein
MRESGAVATWTTHTKVSGLPEQVLALLTEPDAIARWAPIEFEVLDFDGRRLFSGDHVRVHGSLAGRCLEFEVDVAEAEGGRLVLSATGLIRLDVEYLATALDDGSEVRASVAVSGRGLIGRVLAQAHRCAARGRRPERGGGQDRARARTRAGRLSPADSARAG